jgi:hypothetical protein
MSKENYTPFRLKYSDITGDNNSALMLAQLEFWDGIKKGGWVVKSVSDWWNELRITPKQVKRIKAELETLGYIETSLVQWNNSQTTAYLFKKQAVEEAVNNGFDAYTTHPKSTGALGIGAKSTGALGTGAHSQKVLVHTTKRDASITEITTENTTENTCSEINSLLPKTDLVKKEMAERIERGEAAKTKPKKPKEISPLDKEIAVKIQEVGKRFIKWYEAHKKTPYLSKKQDFINLTATFSQLCNKKGYTPDMVVKEIEKIVNGYDKLSNFSQNNFSLNLIATKYNVLLSEIESYKAPVTKQNYNEPVAPVHTKLPEFYNGYALPMGISTMQFEKLGELVYRDKIMEGLIDESFMSVYEFLEKYRGELKKITTEQLNQLMKDYEIA